MAKRTHTTGTPTGGHDEPASHARPDAAAPLAARVGHIHAENLVLTRATDDLVAMLSIAEHLRDRPWLIQDLVALAIQALALDTIGHVITDHPALLSDDDLTRLAHAAGAIGAAGPLVRFDGERLMFDDTLQRLYSDDGRGNGVLTRDGLALIQHFTSDLGSASPLTTGDEAADLTLGPIQSAVVADRASTRALYNHFIDQIERRRETPLWDQVGKPSLDVEIERAYSNPLSRARHPIAMLMIPALEHAVRMGERQMLRRDTTVTLIALELHRRRTGEYPAALADISPTLLPIRPMDRLTGDPLGYALVNGEPLIYSRGPDQDDDRGRPASGRYEANYVGADNPFNALFNGRGQSLEWDGDWVLWPPAPPAQ